MAGSVGQYTQGWWPFMATKGNTGWATRTQSNAELGLGRLITDNTNQNNLWTTDAWMDTGTWKLCLVHGIGADQGIYNVTGISGTQTVDGYSAGTVSNVYTEVTGIAVGAGLKTIQVQMATKHASSSAYGAKLNSIALIRTSGTASTPVGTDTPGYTWQWIPWMGSKANTNWSTLNQASTRLGGGILESTNAINNEISADAWIDSGTVKVALVHETNTNRGQYSVQFDTVEKGVIEGYSGSQVANVYTEVTGIAVAASGTITVKLKMASQHGSSSGYYGAVNSMAVVRTGA